LKYFRFFFGGNIEYLRLSEKNVNKAIEQRIAEVARNLNINKSLLDNARARVVHAEKESEVLQRIQRNLEEQKRVRGELQAQAKAAISTEADKTVNRIIDDRKAAMKNLAAAEKSYSNESAYTKRQLDITRNTLSKLTQLQSQWKGQIGITAKQMRRLSGRLTRLRNEIKKLSTQYKEQLYMERRLQKGMINASLSAEEFKLKLKEMGVALASTITPVGLLNNALYLLESRFGKFLLFYALIQGIRGIVEYTKALDYQLQRLGTSLSVTYGDDQLPKVIGNIESMVRLLSASTGVAVEKVADVMTEFTYAQLNIREAFYGTTQAIQLAIASSRNWSDVTSNAIDVSRTIIGVYINFKEQLQEVGSVQEQMTYIAGALWNAYQKQVTTIDEMASALKYAIGPMSQFGYTIQETIALVSVAQTAFLRGSRAGTGLSRVVIDIVKNFRVLEQTFDTTFRDIEGRPDIVKILEHIRALLSKSGGDTIELQRRLFNIVPQVRALRLILATLDIERLKDQMDSISEDPEKLREAFDKMMRSMEARSARFGAAWRSALDAGGVIEFWERIKGLGTSFFEFISWERIERETFLGRRDDPQLKQQAIDIAKQYNINLKDAFERLQSSAETRALTPYFTPASAEFIAVGEVYERLQLTKTRLEGLKKAGADVKLIANAEEDLKNIQLIVDNLNKLKETREKTFKAIKDRDFNLLIETFPQYTEEQEKALKELEVKIQEAVTNATAQIQKSLSDAIFDLDESKAKRWLKIINKYVEFSVDLYKEAQDRILQVQIARLNQEKVDYGLQLEAQKIAGEQYEKLMAQKQKEINYRISKLRLDSEYATNEAIVTDAINTFNRVFQESQKIISRRSEQLRATGREIIDVSDVKEEIIDIDKALNNVISTIKEVYGIDVSSNLIKDMSDRVEDFKHSLDGTYKTSLAVASAQYKLKEATRSMYDSLRAGSEETKVYVNTLHLEGNELKQLEAQIKILQDIQRSYIEEYSRLGLVEEDDRRRKQELASIINNLTTEISATNEEIIRLDALLKRDALSQAIKSFSDIGSAVIDVGNQIHRVTGLIGTDFDRIANGALGIADGVGAIVESVATSGGLTSIFTGALGIVSGVISMFGDATDKAVEDVKRLRQEYTDFSETGPLGADFGKTEAVQNYYTITQNIDVLDPNSLTPDVQRRLAQWLLDMFRQLELTEGRVLLPA
jgi:TP901 family phage tail tape measure protein